ncbi:hypothetical protein [Aquimarina algicola]|uniref:Uncharacterized protein n=1 Tax=Aquimarina algicola TaxID=2589995 RepID=A0A504JAU2_9FLAO|nr:hypothetical protein [Aquimarina algicola]TPN83381.1 hypothetical protein FHK87_19360 [Aquimarina algicola]
MKSNQLIFKGILFVLFSVSIISCNKEITEEETFNSSDQKNELVDELESTFDMDARIATLYALKYARVIDPEFRFSPNSPQTPRFISGEKANTIIDLSKLPVEEEEIAFIKELITQKESRAIVIKEVKDRANNTSVDLLYIPYPKGMDVPSDFIFQNGILIDSFYVSGLVTLPWPLPSVGLEGAKSFCKCTIILRNFNVTCATCPELSSSLKLLFSDYINDDVNNYDKMLSKITTIEEIPLGGSLFDL